MGRMQPSCSFPFRLALLSHVTQGQTKLQQEQLTILSFQEARTISEINPDRSTDPVLEKNYSWSIDQTRKLFSMPEFDIRRDSTVDVEKTRKDNDKTPTPASMRAKKTSSKTNNPDTTSSSNTGSSQSRYVPPQLRGNPSEEKRPLSSISNKSFASQLPSTPKQTNGE